MKIGFLSIFNFGSSIGGVENHIYFISKELVKLGHEIIIFQPIEKEKMINTVISENGIKVIYIPINSPKIIDELNRFNGNKIIGFLTAFVNKAKFIFSYKKIARVVLDSNCDLIHQHDFISNIFTTKYLTKKGLNCILTNHTGEYLFFQKSILGRSMLKYLLCHFKSIIGPSKELTPLPYNQNSFTIYNGVDLNLFYEYPSNKNSELKLKYDLRKEDYLIFCPRRWAPTKGVVYLIESIIKNDFPHNFKFLFAGSDYDGYIKYSDEINKMILASDKKNQIIKLGNLDISDMIDVYNISDIVIIPSLMEAVSLSAIESMATGTPVISTNVGGMPELINNNVNGILINPKNQIEIYNSITNLHTDSDKYDRIYRESLKTAQNFSWESIAKKTNEIYLFVEDMKND